MAQAGKKNDKYLRLTDLEKAFSCAHFALQTCQICLKNKGATTEIEGQSSMKKIHEIKSPTLTEANRWKVARITL